MELNFLWHCSHCRRFGGVAFGQDSWSIRVWTINWRELENVSEQIEQETSMGFGRGWWWW